MLETNPADIRKSYLKEMDAMRQRMRLACERTRQPLRPRQHRAAAGGNLSGYLVFRHKVYRAMTFLNPAMLFGLLAVSLPVLDSHF